MRRQRENDPQLNLQSRRQLRKGFPFPPEQLIAEVLGITCLVLMSSLVKTIILISSENNSLVPHCAHCPPEGFTYSNNCYYINHGKMSWHESVVACASRRSRLLYIESEEELKFLVSILSPSWVGIFRNSKHHPWMSINGSTSKPKIKDNSAGESNCVIVFSDRLHAEICTYPSSYYCKHKLQN
nr:unnamed protein product [Sorex araneus]